MKIALCIKQVPDTTDIKWTENNTIQRDGVESIINPYDTYAMEFALNIKRQVAETTITVFTMGPSQAEEMLRKALAIGCDDAILISDKKFAGADTYATGQTISQAIKTILPDYDLVVCGQFAVDGDTAQTGPCIASFLNIPQVTYVENFIRYDNKKLQVTKLTEDGIETVEVETPALVCILTQSFETTRAKINGIISASKKEIRHCTYEDLGLPAEKLGLKGSPTYVSRAFRNISTHNAQKHKLTLEQSVQLLKETIQTRK